MERTGRPDGMSIPEEYAVPRDAMRYHANEDIRVQLSDIRKEIEDTNRILKSIQEGLAEGRS